MGIVIHRPPHKRMDQGEGNPRNAFARKTPNIVFDSLFFNGQAYPIQLLGDRTNTETWHRTYIFTGVLEIEINGNAFAVQNLALRILNPLRTLRNPGAVILREIAHYRKLQNLGLPVPVLIADPTNIHDPQNEKNGRFWLVENVPYPVNLDLITHANNIDELPLGTQNALHLVKAFLTSTDSRIMDQREFKVLMPKDVKIRENGQAVIVDFSPPNTTADDEEVGGETELQKELYYCALTWANNNPKVFDWLIGGLTQGTQTKMNLMFVERAMGEI